MKTKRSARSLGGMHPDRPEDPADEAGPQAPGGHRLARAREDFRAGDFAACAERCRHIAAQAAADPEALHLLGAALMRRGEIEAGLSALAGAQALAPMDVALRIDRALALAMAGRLAEGIDVLADGWARQPGEPNLAAKLGELLSDADRFDEAERVLAAAVGRAPRHVALRCLLAAEYAGSLKTEAALEQLAEARRLRPDNVKILVNIGVLYQALGDLDAAIGHYRDALAAGPDGQSARPNLATALLTRFDFEAGFAEFESRLLLGHIRVPETAAPRWRGEDIAGRRLLVTAEQGYGDMLQFARFLPPAARLAGHVTLECHPGLERLFAALPGVDRVVTLGQPLPEADVAVSLLSLPFVGKWSMAGLSETIPYLAVPPGGAFDLPDDPGMLPGHGLFKVGLVWAGRPATGEVYVRRSLNRRSCPLAALRPLTTIPGVRFYSLQVGAAAQQVRASGLPIVDLADRLGDFADTAAAIAAMDLTISVDTAAAHLAGGMGAPLWVLLAPGQADYRWGVAGGTPWYPHARLFRAERAGWATVVEVMAAELKRLVEARSHPDLQPGVCER